MNTELLHQVFIEWSVDIFVFDARGQLVCSAARLYDGEPRCLWTAEQLGEMREACRTKDMPLIYAWQCIYYMALCDHDDYLYVVGPVSEGIPSSGERREFLNQQSSFYADYLLPDMSEKDLFRCFFLTAGLIGDKKIGFRELLESCGQKPWDVMEDMERASVRTDHKESTRYGYDVESRWLQGIREGELLQFGGGEYAFRTIGEMVEKRSMKQTEYMAVTVLSLASRAAVDGGVDWLTAMEIMDAYTRRIAACTNSLEILKIIEQAQNDYVSRVRRERERPGGVSYLRQAKAYINNHIREKIQLEDVAAEVGLNPSYLSRLFSEKEGITMRQYINKKKLERAANMLKYSDLALASVASHFSFSSQSYFAGLFRKEYGVGPMEYRKTFQ